MEIKQLTLDNLGRFERLAIEFAPTQRVNSKVTVLIGNNGAGKTSVLKSLATSLSWFVARLRSDKGNGSPIPEEVILNGANTAVVSLQLHDQQREYRWSLTRTRAGRKSNEQSILVDASKLADEYRARLTEQENVSVPLIAFYPVERGVLDIPLKIKERHSFFQLDGYDNSLNQGVDFRRFFEWFREREDSENESVIPEDVLKQLEKTLAPSIWQTLQQQQASARDRQLTAVRVAIANFMPGFENLKVRRKPRLHMSIDKEGQTFNVLQLSQGEKSLMALVGDIARRLAMMNPELENPLHGDGVVLIDEVDMHLHPQWARTIIQRLTDTFPNCQFVLTTHSPLVISDCKDVLVYSLDNGELTEVPSQYGQDANSVLLEVMDTAIRNERVANRLNDLLDLIQDRHFDKANALLAELKAELPANNLELTKASLLLRKEELRRAQD
ncbi:ATP-binding protein [Aeromonas schubertii]|uniref:AAA family ATPase n=1 Tax=Aeromonas schubertii TaxID=652 RepID=UPI00067EDB7B|nr:AAA family ATPase [Aeromonas schubertii]KUE81838.1 ATP-binding protein [Aeromonas schubertii]